MEFSLTGDQAAIVSALDRLASDHTTVPTDFADFTLTDPALDAALESGQYFDIAAIPELGSVTAALAVERLARLPCAVESALSMLVRPQLSPVVPRPLAVIEDDRPGRFVCSAQTLLLIADSEISIVHPQPDDVEAVDSIYAYPMGQYRGDAGDTVLRGEAAELIFTWLRIACATEMAGLMQAAVDATVAHLSVREQFGRPLGMFQGLRHRLAECAVLVGGVRRLALKAAWSGDPGDAALAVLHAQDSAIKINYDVHQMLGAMGMTLEMSLHLWTYRSKALLSELGGRSAQAAVVADRCF